jgi:RHS repeat-associated protein
VLGYTYNYNYFNEHTGRVTYAQNIANGTLANGVADGTLDRSYEYDHVGRLSFSHSGAEARAHVGLGQWGTMDGPFSQGYDYDVWGNLTRRYGWGGEVQGGGAGQSSDLYYYYDTHNRRTGFSYDNAGNLTFDGGQNFTYDATGQQTNASYSGYSLQQSYDGDGLRVKKVENGSTTYYLRSSVLGGQVVAEIIWASVSWQWNRGYVYAGSQLLAVQQAGVNWMHEDPITKSKRVTNSAGTVVSTIELDPWGADTGRSSNAAFQPKKFTSYERDSNGTDEAMFRRYNRWHSRFDQPDPAGGSYDMGNPQSLNRYTYVQNDPVNFVDPSGLKPQICGLFSGSNNGDPWTGLVCFGDSNPFYGYSPKDREPPDPAGKEPQNPGSQQSSNENCILNALSSSRGLARTFGDVLPNGTINHPGVHGLAPLGQRATVSTLPALTGVVVGPIHIGGEGGGDGSRIVDVLLDNGNVAIYADLVTVNVHPGQRLNAGTVIGTVGGSSNPKDYSGLHFGLLKGNGNGRAADRDYRSRTARGLLSPAGNFIDPLGPNSPVNCPGVTADPAGVPPVP